jgi:hypothetical protein
MIQATELGSGDKEKIAFAWEVVKGSNEVVVSFARLMAAVALTAVGVVLTLAKLAGLEGQTSAARLVWLALTCGVYLLSSLVFSYAVRGQRLAVSPDDFEDVVEQFLAAANRRHRATEVGLVLLAIATISSILVIVTAFAG